MTKKLEYARPVYYCGLKQDLDNPYSDTECFLSPHPDCRRCPERNELEKKWAYKKMRAAEGQPI